MAHRISLFPLFQEFLDYSEGEPADRAIVNGILSPSPGPHGTPDPRGNKRCLWEEEQGRRWTRELGARLKMGMEQGTKNKHIKGKLIST